MRKTTSVLLSLLLVLTTVTLDSHANSTCTTVSYRNGPGLCGDYPKECSPGTDKLDLLWSNSFGMDIPAAPVTDGSKIYICLPNAMVYCYDAWTGKKIWQFEAKDICGAESEERPAGIVTSPAILDGKLYFGTTCGKIICLSTDKGTKLWQQHVSLRQFISPIVLIDKYLLSVTDDRTCECIDISTGKYMWTEPCIGNGFSPPCAENGMMYLPYDNGLKCFDIAKHERNNYSGYGAASNRHVGIPAIEGGRIYYASVEPPLYSFHASSGSYIWKQNYTVTTAICVTTDKLFFGEEKGLTCADRSMGQKLWQFETKAVPVAGPVHCDGRVYFGTADNMFYCVNAEGKKLFSYKTESIINDTIICSNGQVFFTTKQGRLYCFGPEGSSKLPGKLVLTPLSKKLVPGQSTLIKADFIDRDGKPMEETDLEWSVSPQDAGKVENNTFTAGNFAGKATITACAGRACESTVIEVLRASDVVGYINVSPDSEKIIESQPVQFQAKAYDKTAKVIQNTSFAWKVEPQDSGTIDQNGLFTPSNGGKCKVYASIAEISGTYEANIVGIAQIKVSPEDASVAFGKSIQYLASAKDGTGNDISGLKATWSIEPETLGAIDKDGLFTAGKTTGSGTIIATVGKKSGKTSIIVTGQDTAPFSCDQTSLDFGNLEAGQSETMKLTVTNNTKEEIVVTASSQTDWLKTTPDKLVIEPSSSLAFDVIASTVSKPAGQLSSKIVLSAKDFALDVPVKLSVVKLSECFYVTSNKLSGEVEPDKTVILTVSVGCGKSTPVKVAITSSNKNVTPKTATIGILKSAILEFEVSTSGLKAGEKIEGSITLTPSVESGCKTLSIPFRLTARQKQVLIWLQIGNSTAKIDGKETKLQVPPQVIKGNTMVPLRFIAEAFGCKVDWNSAEKKITITRGSFEMVLWMDKTTAKINGQDKVMKAPPTSVKGSTLVPLRFIAEAFGATVNFNSKTQEIDILWAPY
ncbi:MAG: PQQ-binding-like beta-propeller repeat protein [Caldisericia bacterium]|nr:PQQ-binding-like beta-propeller repeat protein [Caldisericia bacterium]